MENFQDWSDEQVLRECVRYGEEARKWRNRFLGLLPEVHRRKLYEKHGCSSVFEFAYKVGGVSEAQVKDAIRFEERLQETPLLHGLLVRGEVSMHKIERVLSIAEPANDEFLANQVQILSQRAVDTLVRDIKHVDVNIPSPGDASACARNIELDPELVNRLEELKQKGIHVSELLTQLLDRREQEIEQEKEVIAQQCKQANSRYIPSRTRRIVVQEYGTKCSIRTCHKLSQQIHHTQRFSLSKMHNPHYLAPLCKEHHEMAHARDVMVQELRKRT